MTSSLRAWARFFFIAAAINLAAFVYIAGKSASSPPPYAKRWILTFLALNTFGGVLNTGRLIYARSGNRTVNGASSTRAKIINHG